MASSRQHQNPKTRRSPGVRKRPAPLPAPSTRGRLLRGIFGLGIIFLFILALASVFMRSKVIALLDARALTASSVVLTRAIPITRGSSFAQLQIESRLKRLGYERVNFIPRVAGQYVVEGDHAIIFFRGAHLSTGQTQEALLVDLHLDERGVIQDLREAKFQQPLAEVWIEPELISMLGSSAMRLSQAKRLEEFSPLLIQAVLSIEDERFYSHFGIDPIAVLRATVRNLRAGRVVEGGSTITQQLAKNLFFTPERTLSRKLIEAASALVIETAFSKDKILEFYLNEVFLGQEGNFAIHGFGEASESFFGKDVAHISLAEAATLAGMIKAPSRFNPRRSAERAQTRRKLVLAKMYERGEISETALKRARSASLTIREAQRARRTAPFFVDYVRKTLALTLDHYEIEPEEILIHTGLDLEYQACAEEAVSKGLSELEAQYPRLKRGKAAVQSALIAVSPVDGSILSWVGGREYQANQFDRVHQARRQPGSAFKPFVYLTALDRELNSYRVARTTTILDDTPMTFPDPVQGSWSPKNYDNKFLGEVTLRQALMTSRNIPTVYLAEKVGIQSVARAAELMGLGEGLSRVRSLALGAVEVSPLELARAYTTLANGGVLLYLHPIVSVTKVGEANPLLAATAREKRVASEPAVFVLNNILQSAIESGTGRGVRTRGFHSPAAGKTGTTNEARDSWFAGFTPKLLAIVWVGFDDNSALGLTGAQAALPIWTDFMKCASKMEPVLEFIPPQGVLWREIDADTGLLATPYCPKQNVVTEVFVEHTEPVTPCPKHAPRSWAESFDDERRLFGQGANGREQTQGQSKSWSRFFDRLWSVD